MGGIAYWRQRAEQRSAAYHDQAVYFRQLETAYRQALEDIGKDIEAIIKNFSKSSGLTIAEAKGILKSQYIDFDYYTTVRKYLSDIEDPAIAKKMLAQVESLAYRGRISRYEELKATVNLEMMMLADKEITAGKALMGAIIDRAYTQTMFQLQQGTGIGFSFALLSKRRIDTVLNTAWSGRNYSERVWRNTQALGDLVYEKVMAHVTTGKSVARLTEDLSDLSSLGDHAARRLLRTEITYVANLSEIASYEEGGIEQYQFLATLDLKTSEICRDLDLEPFPVSKAQAGENLPPMHPWCRSTTIPVLPDQFKSSIGRRARNPETGEWMEVPSDMDYRQWYQQYVVDRPKAEVEERKVKNASADKGQYERYRGTLGKAAPKTFQDFQEMKYEQPEKWAQLKLLYRREGKTAP